MYGQASPTVRLWFLQKHAFYFKSDNIVCDTLMTSYRRAGACSRHNSIRTVGDACPYSEKTSVYVLSHPKSISGATRQVIAHTKKRCERDAASLLTNFKALWARRGGVVALTARWAVNSQSGEQFIIATRGFSPGHSRKCPGAFLLLFQHLKKKIFHTVERTKVPTTLSVGYRRHLSRRAKL